MFDLSKSQAHKAIKYPIWVIIPAQIVLFMLATLFLLFFLFPPANGGVAVVPEKTALGVFLVLVSINLWCIIFWMFYSLRLKNFRPPMLPSEVVEFSKNNIMPSDDVRLNLAEYLDLDAARVAEKAIRFAANKNIALSTAVLLHALLKNRRSDFIFNRLLVSKDEFAKSIEVIADSQFKRAPDEAFYTDEFETLIKSALSFAAKHAHGFVTVSDFFSAAISTDKTVERLFFDFGVKKDDLIHVALWGERYHEEYEAPKPFLSHFAIVKGLADDWAYGYTPTLDAYSRPVRANAPSAADHLHILARNSEIEQVEMILAQSGNNNVVLVGEAGVGKKSVVAGLAQRIFLGDCPPQLTHKRLAQLDMNMLLSRSRDQATAVALTDKILDECRRAGNVILVVEDLHNFVGPQRKEELGALDISGVLLPYLRSDVFQLVGLTDNAGYHANIEGVSAVAVTLEKVAVPELDEEQTLAILEDIIPKIERRYGLFVSYHALYEAIVSTGSFIQNIPFPRKAIELLNETLSFVATHKLFGKVVTQDHVTEVVSQKTGIPLGRVEGEEKAKLLNLETLLHERIIGQDAAIKEVAQAMRRVRSGVGEREKPIGTFLFLGPTGVGKTETAKALAAVYFGSEERMIRLDMTEYQEADSLNRLIGNIDTQTEAQFANAIREHPFSLVVLDELEKSHPNVMNLFLQILDEGRLTDVFQKQVSFKNTIIIATSNAGAEFIREYIAIGQNSAALADKLKEHLLRSGAFKPEFLNRFDGVIVFEPLKAEEVKQVAFLMLNDLRERLERQGYLLKIDEKAVDKIAKEGFNQAFGARELRRVIQDKVENKIAERIIKGEYKPGDTIMLSESDI